MCVLLTNLAGGVKLKNEKENQKENKGKKDCCES